MKDAQLEVWGWVIIVIVMAFYWMLMRAGEEMLRSKVG